MFTVIKVLKNAQYNLKKFDEATQALGIAQLTNVINAIENGAGLYDKWNCKWETKGNEGQT